MTSVNANDKFYENDNGVYFKSGYLSQWYIAPFIYNGITYNCCEQRMMHAKALFFGDLETATAIMNTNEPKEQKKLGRSVKNFDEYSWNNISNLIVYNANLQKFSQNEKLKKLLLATNDKIIVECSPYDNIWGNGLDITTTLKTPMNEWKGANRLGYAIMKVRDLLKSEL